MAKKDYVLEKALKGDLHEVSITILGGDLGGHSILDLAAVSAIRILRDTLAKTKNEDPYLSAMTAQDLHVFLSFHALDLECEEIDALFGFDSGFARARIDFVAEDSGRSGEEWCDLLDEQAALIPLPSGIIESVVDSFESEAD